MENTLIVGDIAGQYDALIRLIARVSGDTQILALGDLVDRGPKSKEVVEWFMANEHRAEALMGNHEHMMVDFVEDRGCYAYGIWHGNGGSETMKSYDPQNRVFVPLKHIYWLDTRKRFKHIPAERTIPELFASHAALRPELSIAEAAAGSSFYEDHFEQGLLWNRGEPKKAPFFQIMGHNAHWGLRYFEDWGVCIDTSRSEVLTGFMWPSRKVYQEPY